jgi:hypothetical protein
MMMNYESGYHELVAQLDAARERTVEAEEATARIRVNRNVWRGEAQAKTRERNEADLSAATSHQFARELESELKAVREVSDFALKQAAEAASERDAARVALRTALADLTLADDLLTYRQGQLDIADDSIKRLRCAAESTFLRVEGLKAQVYGLEQTLDGRELKPIIAREGVGRSRLAEEFRGELEEPDFE